MPFKPTFEQAVLIQKIADGKIEHLRDLWPTLFDTPFDPKRPVEDVVKDVADKMGLPEDDKKAAPTHEEILAAALEFGRLFGEMFGTSPKNRKA